MVRRNRRDDSQGTMGERIKESGLDKLYIAGVCALHAAAVTGLHVMTYVAYNN